LIDNHVQTADLQYRAALQQCCWWWCMYICILYN